MDFKEIQVQMISYIDLALIYNLYRKHFNLVDFVIAFLAITGGYNFTNTKFCVWRAGCGTGKNLIYEARKLASAIRNSLIVSPKICSYSFHYNYLIIIIEILIYIYIYNGNYNGKL